VPRRAVLALLSAAVTALLAAPRPARADGHADDAHAAAARADDGHGHAAGALHWQVNRGTLQAGRTAGSWLLASDAVPGRYSVGEVVSAAEVALPYRFTVRWRRIGPEAGRSMHVLVAGGIVLIKSGAINFYAYDDAAFASGAWQPLAGHRAQDEHTVVVSQDAHQVVVTVDGAAAARYPLEVARPTAHVGVGMKAAPGLRSKIYLRALTLEPLQ
jgi:hypothetical protein